MTSRTTKIYTYIEYGEGRHPLLWFGVGPRAEACVWFTDRRVRDKAP